METLNFEYPASQTVVRSAHVGVVGSGDLEILLEPSDGLEAQITVRTSADGFADTWEAVFDRFFERNDVGGRFELNDQGATPGTVSLRLAQAIEESQS